MVVVVMSFGGHPMNVPGPIGLRLELGSHPCLLACINDKLQFQFHFQLWSRMKQCTSYRCEAILSRLDLHADGVMCKKLSALCGLGVVWCRRYYMHSERRKESWVSHQTSHFPGIQLLRCLTRSHHATTTLLYCIRLPRSDPVTFLQDTHETKFYITVRVRCSTYIEHSSFYQSWCVCPHRMMI